MKKAGTAAEMYALRGLCRPSVFYVLWAYFPAGFFSFRFLFFLVSFLFGFFSFWLIFLPALFSCQLLHLLQSLTDGGHEQDCDGERGFGAEVPSVVAEGIDERRHIFRRIV